MKKKFFGLLFLCIVVLMGIDGCSHLTIKQTDNYVEITGLKFRKKGSINTDMLWAGVAKTSGTNTFEPKFFPELEHEINFRKVTEAFNTQTAKVAYEAAVKAGVQIAKGNISGNISSETEVKGNYHVFKLFDVNEFVRELNLSRNRENLESLMGYDDPRIITSIAVVFNYQANEKINRSGEVNVTIKKANIGNPEIALKIINTGETVAKLSDGTVFAFEYSRLCWEKRDGKIILKSLEVDRPGFDNDCPSGTKDNAKELNR